ncbi:hypothetical protein DEI81_04730 [Curtobacterium sp. MCBD17_013]|nr:hypothetical protein DEI81_04730 [Curtobacterium sp. MCBD17_013]
MACPAASVTAVAVVVPGVPKNAGPDTLKTTVSPGDGVPLPESTLNIASDSAPPAGRTDAPVKARVAVASALAAAAGVATTTPSAGTVHAAAATTARRGNEDGGTTASRPVPSSSVLPCPTVGSLLRAATDPTTGP